MSDQVEFSTPMMKQYMEIKKQYPDCLLFFRLGDFYELFLDDALTGSRILDITLTGRPRGKDGKIPMAGVPFHAVDAYLAKLVKAGYKVAICEQVTEPDKYGIVEREVVRVVTPGTVLDEKSLVSRENNFIVALAISAKKIGVACADISTGEFKATELGYTSLEKTLTDELTRIFPSECILRKKDYDNPLIMKIVSGIQGLNTYCFQGWEEITHDSAGYLCTQLNLKSLQSTGIAQKEQAQEASAALYAYLKETQKEKLFHIKSITELRDADHMVIDRATILNLELFSSLRESHKTGTLISVIDHTQTAMGARLLRQWVIQPLISRDRINARLNAVECIMQNHAITENLSMELQKTPDIERITSRIAVGTGNARDLVSLKNGLKAVVHCAQLSKDCQDPLIRNNMQIITKDTQIQTLVDTIEKTIQDDPAFDVKEGGIIKENVDPELDKHRKKTYAGKEWIAELEQSERAKTGINSLKVRFNKVFGFYIEVSNANLAHIPEHYFRKQTLVNGERFTTKELKEQEEKILEAEEKSQSIEYEIFLKVQQSVIERIEYIQAAARAIAELDCLISFAACAKKNRYTKPEMTETGEIAINSGRHPVVEKLITETEFVPNSIHLDHNKNQLMLITGPNMAGKSVFMRQVALITLLAHIGSFVPASSATISITDRIFVRSGAADMISAGLSTFMVEMVETAYILAHATKNSLIIMDEIGRGTSTYDGISIAWSIAEHLVTNNKLKTKTLFATHYHELQKLEEEYPHAIKNFHMAIHEENGQPVFLHTIKPGGAAHSFGVAVARLAGIPDEVISRAREMLHQLETRTQSESQVHERPAHKEIISPEAEDMLLQELNEIDIHQTTPLQALNKLAELKNKARILHKSPSQIFKAD